MIERSLLINNKLGLHARAAAKLVNCAGGFESKILLTRNGREVNAKSIMGVMMLAAACGSEVVLRVEGADAEAAVTAIEGLINDKFGEGE